MSTHYKRELVYTVKSQHFLCLNKSEPLCNNSEDILFSTRKCLITFENIRRTHTHEFLNAAESNGTLKSFCKLLISKKASEN